MTANARAFVPLLRRLREAKWDRKQYGHSTEVEYVWRRGGTANLQQITVNVTGAMVQINGRTFTTTELEPGEAWTMLLLLGALDPAPERVNYRNVKAVA